jgi:hypothetical protein
MLVNHHFLQKIPFLEGQLAVGVDLGAIRQGIDHGGLQKMGERFPLGDIMAGPAWTINPSQWSSGTYAPEFIPSLTLWGDPPVLPPDRSQDSTSALPSSGYAL